MRIFLVLLASLLLGVIPTPALAQSRTNEAVAANNSANDKFNRGNYDGAIADWTRAMALLPADAAYAFNRGLARKLKLDFAGASEDFSTAIRLNPLEARYYAERGLVRAQSNDPEGAIGDFTAAIGRKPEPWLYADRGLARLRINEPAAAIADLTTALRLKPDEAVYYAARSIAYVRSKDAAAAILDADRSVALEPRSALRRLNRSRVYWQLGNLPEALTNVNAALTLDPRFASAYIERGVLLQVMGDPDGALADFRRALESGASERYVHFLHYLASKAKTPTGFAALARTVANWPPGWERSAGLYLIESITEKELLGHAATGSAFLRREKLADAHYYVGMVALLAGNTGKAREHLQKAVAQGARGSYTDLLAGAQLKALK